MALISFDEAFACVRSHAAPANRTVVSDLEAAGGLALAETVCAREPYPRFNNSAVDGYAIGCAEDALAGCTLAIEQVHFAGSGKPLPISPGACARILTGAMVPPNTYAVVMQEYVRREGERVTLLEDAPGQESIRRQARDFDAGAELATIGTNLNAGTLAMLASQGISQATVYPRPRAAILTTGDELVDYRSEPPTGSLRDTNGIMLAHQFRTAGIDARSEHVPDDADLLKSKVREAASLSDVLVVTGGASVGDRDYVPETVGALGQIFFHGVSMRPGKPILFGKVGNCLVFGLPGNPASAFVGFELLVRPSLKGIGGHLTVDPVWVPIPLGADHEAVGREDFVRVVVEGGIARPLPEQGSFGLRSLSRANGLARLPANDAVKAGAFCPVLLLDAFGSVH